MSVRWFGAEYEREFRKRAAGALARAAILLQADIKQSMGGAKYGSLRQMPGGTYRVSSGPVNRGEKIVKRFHAPPGAVPAVQTGRLLGSIDYELDAAALTARVGTNVKYGRYLELGTSKMAARPFLRPALDRKRREIVAQFEGLFR